MLHQSDCRSRVTQGEPTRPSSDRSSVKRCWVTPANVSSDLSMKLLHVVGARPNFPKLAPVYRAGQRAGLEQFVVHTGQHYDDAMSASFFRDLSIAPPDAN